MSQSNAPHMFVTKELKSAVEEAKQFEKNEIYTKSMCLKPTKGGVKVNTFEEALESAKEYMTTEDVFFYKNFYKHFSTPKCVLPKGHSGPCTCSYGKFFAEQYAKKIKDCDTTTGGIGPTHDDITAASISKAFKLKYEYHQEAYKILEKYYGKKNFNDGRKKMAMMPRGSKLIYNPSSSAPGFLTKNVLSLPGVPSILSSMIENCKRYLIKGLKIHSKTINLYTVESNISKKLGLIQKKYKKTVDIGSYPFFRLGKIGVSIVTRSTSRIELKKVNNDLSKLIKLKKIKILKI